MMILWKSHKWLIRRWTVDQRRMLNRDVASPLEGRWLEGVAAARVKLEFRSGWSGGSVSLGPLRYYIS
jgi:hypothetical protein